MFLGLSPFTWFHTLISLLELVAGFVVVVGLLESRMLNGWTALFLITAVATSVTGFGFPFDRFLPSHWVAVISLATAIVALLARYAFHLAGAWRWVYAVGVVATLYFDVFVAVAQAFGKIPALRPLAPTQSEPPFAIAQGVVLVIFVVLGIAAARKFHPNTAVVAYSESLTHRS